MKALFYSLSPIMCWEKFVPFLLRLILSPNSLGRGRTQYMQIHIELYSLQFTIKLIAILETNQMIKK